MYLGIVENFCYHIIQKFPVAPKDVLHDVSNWKFHSKFNFLENNYFKHFWLIHLLQNISFVFICHHLGKIWIKLIAFKKKLTNLFQYANRLEQPNEKVSGRHLQRILQYTMTACRPLPTFKRTDCIIHSCDWYAFLAGFYSEDLILFW